MAHSPRLGAPPASRPTPTGNALVLGGGGALGNAWLIGLAAGLDAAGLRVGAADVVIGTSAGATAAAQVTAAHPADLMAAVLDAPPRPAPARGRRGPAPGAPTSPLEATNALIAAATDAADARRRLGAWALERAAADPRARDRWRATVADRLPRDAWPQQQRLLVTAVDAVTGEPVVFDRDSGVGLVDAVAASCSSGSAYEIAGRHYVDGGYRSNADNADLAAGCATVLVLSPFGGRSRFPAEWGLRLAHQVEQLRARGSRVETVFPDDRARAVFGDDMTDLSGRAAAALAGHAHGAALADRLAAAWRGVDG